MSQQSQEYRAVNTFVSRIQVLDQIEAQIGNPRTFNTFEAIGATRQELRHSDFLAFLLDPQQTHELGDAFLRALLRELTGDEGDVVAPERAQGFEAIDLSATTVRREMAKY